MCYEGEKREKNESAGSSVTVSISRATVLGKAEIEALPNPLPNHPPANLGTLGRLYTTDINFTSLSTYLAISSHKSPKGK